MSSINIQNVAHLARLHLTHEEALFLQGQVGQILGFVEKLNDVKGLEGVVPTSHPFSLSDVFREDTVSPSLAIEEFLKKSPQARGRFFQVPKVIEDKA